jgi:hypothetical protein
MNLKTIIITIIILVVVFLMSATEAVAGRLLTDQFEERYIREYSEGGGRTIIGGGTGLGK